MYTRDDLSGTHHTTGNRRRRRAVIVASVVVATVAVGSAFGLVAFGGAGSSASGTANDTATQNGFRQAQARAGFGHTHYPSNGYGSGGYDGSSSAATGSNSTPTVTATTAQQVGVVDVISQLGYDSAESAGTGMVLTSTGEILTNNHVIEGSTSISVTVVSTGISYTASLVGTDAADDIAVLQLSGASGLSVANVDGSSAVSVGDVVTGVGNAGGTGGAPSAVSGRVTALDQTITTQPELAAVSETLNGLIESDADIQAGDSGGPLYNANNKVIGIDTAAQAGGSSVAGYSIPISTALSIADQIEAGHASSRITIGYPAFLGVEVMPDATGYGSSSQTVTPGAAVAGVIGGTAAASAGIAAGDTITAVNGATIASSSDLTATLARYTPGQRVTLSWVDASGASATATVTLGTGPAA